MTLAGDLLCFLNSRSRPLFSADIKIQMVVLVLVLLFFCPPSNYHSIIIADASDNAPKPLQKAAGKRRSKAETVKWSGTIAVPWDTPVCYHLESMIIHSDTLAGEWGSSRSRLWCVNLAIRRLTWMAVLEAPGEVKEHFQCFLCFSGCDGDRWVRKKMVRCAADMPHADVTTI